jgi:WD40 repeat protein
VKLAEPLLILEGHGKGLYRAAFSPDGKYMATPGRLGTVRVYDATTGARARTLGVHTASVSDLAFSADGKRLATAAGDHTAKVWDLQTGRAVRTVRTENARPYQAVALSPDGASLATGDFFDGALRVWDVRTGKVRLTTAGHAQGVMRAVYSPDGRRLASAGYEGVVKVWDAGTGKQLLTLAENREAPVWDVAFSPDGKTIATAAIPLGPRTEAVKLWDAATGALLRRIRTDPRDDAYSVAFSPDGKRIASSASAWQGEMQLAGGFRLWDVATGREVLKAMGHDREVTSVAFSPDGKRLATAGLDGKIKIWDVEQLLEGRPARRAKAPGK